MLTIRRECRRRVTQRFAGRSLAAMALFAGFSALARADSPDPLALLRGVEQARTGIQSGRLDITTNAEQYLPWAQNDNAFLTVTFDGNKRTWSQRYRALVVVGHDPDGRKAKQLEAMNNDREAFVRAGLGKWEDMEIRSAWDGSNFAQYMGSGGASYRKHEHGSPDHVSDPRTLGLGPRFDQITSTVADCLGYQKAGSTVSLVGNEPIAGLPTWHVKVKPHPKVDLHFWIEDREGFRVHKFEFNDSYSKTVYTSQHDNQSTWALPSRVVVQDYNREGKLKSTIALEVTKAELGVPVDASTGTVASLKLPIGEVVADERIGKRLGYWNGESLSDDLNTARAIGMARDASARRRTLWQWTLGGAGICTLVVLAAFLARRFAGKARRSGAKT